MSHGGSLKSIFYALAANAGIAAAKYTAAFFTGSGAMFAEAIHSTADCGNQILLLWGLKKAKQAPSPDYPLGYGKEIYFWSFLVAILLFTVGGMYSLYEGIHKFNAEPETMSANGLWWAVGVLGSGILLEGASLLGCLKEIKKLRGDQSLWQWCKSTRKSELVVILGEDIAAEAGMMLALAFIAIAHVTGNPIYDAIGTICIGALLIIVAIFISIKVKGLLVGQSVHPDVRAAILAEIKAQPQVDEVLNLITLQLGEDVMVAVKAKMKAEQSKALIADINSAESAIKAKFPQVKWLFFEPDHSA